MMSMMIMMKHLQMDGCQESCSVYDEHDDHDDAYAYDHDEAYANGLFRLLGLYWQLIEVMMNMTIKILLGCGYGGDEDNHQEWYW